MKYFLIFLISILFSQNVFAHNGPPYPILVDRKIGINKLSIWADPNTGNGVFSLFIEGEKNSNFIISLKTSPVDDPTHILKTEARLSSEGPERATFSAELPFDRSIMWNVEFSLKQNGNTATSFTLPVDVTPPGPNKLEFAIYFLPFLLLGFVWIKYVLSKRKPPSHDPL